MKQEPTFYADSAREKYNLLTEKLKEGVLHGDENYAPKHIVLESAIGYYDAETMKFLLSLSSFVAIKSYFSPYSEKRSEIIFSK